MVNEMDIDAESRIELVGIKTQEMADFLRKKFAPELRCAMCSSTNMKVLGSDKQLYVFAIRTFLTDMVEDPRKFLFSIVECGNCGYTHMFSTDPLVKARTAESEGKV